MKYFDFRRNHLFNLDDSANILQQLTAVMSQSHVCIIAQLLRFLTQFHLDRTHL